MEALLRSLVTGGAGFIGRHLVSRLLAEGDVIVVDSGECGRPEELPTGVTLHETDVSDLGVRDWEILLEDVDWVFHLAAAKHNTPNVSADLFFAANVNSTWNLAEAAARAKIRKFVFTSSLYAYGSMGPKAMMESDLPTPNTIYGTSKLAGEHLLRTAEQRFGLNYVACRLFFAYGPGQYADGGYKSVIVGNFERMTRSEPPAIFGDGSQALDYVFIDDVVEALMRSAWGHTHGAVFNISSGMPVSIRELTQEMCEVAGFDGDPIYMPSDWTHGSMRFGEPTLAESLLGWRASIRLREGLERTWSSLRNQDA